MSRFRRLFHLRRRDKEAIHDDVNAELQHHLELSVEHLVAHGMSREAALAEAKRRLGADQSVHAAARARERRIGLRDRLDVVAGELRYIFRGFARQRALTALIVVTLALGIGANATIFPMADRLLFRAPAGVVEPDQVYRLYSSVEADSGAPRIAATFSYPDYADMQRVLGGRAELGIYLGTTSSIEGDTARSQRVGIAYVTMNSLKLLGARMARGRYFASEEDNPADPRRVVLISYDLWQTRFGGDPAIIGRRVLVGTSRQYEIVGVVERGFTGIDLEPTHVWMPVAAQGIVSVGGGRWWDDRGARSFGIVARVQGATDFLARDAAAAYRAGRVAAGARDRKTAMIFGSVIEGRAPGQQSQSRRIAPRLVGVSLVLLLVALANVTNLLLARGTQREAELAVRRALGVSRRRLVLAFLLEASVLAVSAAMVATVISAALGGVVRSLLLPNSGWTPSVIDVRAIAFTAVLALACALVAGFVSAFRALRADPNLFLRGARAGAGQRTPWVRNSLLAAQSAMSAMLLIGAGLFVVSLDRVERIDLGYDFERVGFVTPRGDDSATVQAMRQLADELSQRADVDGVALASLAPMRGDLRYAVRIDGRDSALAGPLVPGIMGVSGTFSSTMRQRILRGRAISNDDRRGTPWAVVVSEEAARQWWPGGEALGKCVRVGRPTNPCYTVVGVAANAHRTGIMEAPSAMIWVPLDQGTDVDSPGAMLIRTKNADPLPTLLFVASALNSQSARAGARAMTYDALLAPQLRAWRLGAKLFGAVSLLALTLAVVGLYSMLTATVAQRSGEIGIRMALGATSRSVASLVVRQGLRVVVIGIAIGLAGAAAASKVIASLLYETSARDPLVYALVAMVLLAAAVAAALVPAVRAGRVDPINALRAQ